MKGTGESHTQPSYTELKGKVLMLVMRRVGLKQFVRNLRDSGGGGQKRVTVFGAEERTELTWWKQCFGTGSHIATEKSVGPGGQRQTGSA